MSSACIAEAAAEHASYPLMPSNDDFCRLGVDRNGFDEAVVQSWVIPLSGIVNQVLS
ncbi:hypothetical protein ACFL5O_06460 [Myxococcota bacterium]